MTANRTITETHAFSRGQLEELVKFSAKAQIVGDIYTGDFHGQSVEWRDDGSAVVTTVHAPCEPPWRRTR